MRWTPEQLEAYERKRRPIVLAPANAVARESELHDDILSDCKNRGWLVVHSRMDMRTTTAVGVPDFVIMGDRGRVWWIECKSCGGKLTPEQQAFHAMAKNLGHEVHTVWNFTKYYAIVTGQMVEGCVHRQIIEDDDL